MFDRVAPELLRVAAYVCRDRQAAEDAVQDTFVAAIEARDAWDGARPLLPWLLGMLMHRVREQRRRAARAVAPERAPAPAEELDPAAAAARHEVAHGMLEALDRVAEPYRSALIAHYEQGHAAHELAAEQGIAPGTMRMRLHRGLEQLRAALPKQAWSLGAAPSGSLARMREAVLAAAPPATAPALAPTGLLLGVIAMKPWLTLAAGALLLLAWWGSGQFGADAAPSATTGAPALAAAVEPPTEPPTEPPAAAAEPGAAGPTRSPVSTAPAGARALRVRVVHTDGSPAAGATVRWHFDNHPGDTNEQLRAAGATAEQVLQLTLGSDDREWRAELLCPPHLADADGLVVVPLQGEWIELVARQGASYGELRIATAAAANLVGRVQELALQPERAVRVKVVSATGQPRAGVPLEFVAVSGALRERELGPWSQADGIATLRHARLFFAQWRTALGSHAQNARYFLRVRLPGHDDPGLELPRDLAAAWPEQPLELRLPPCGELQVRLMAHGEPLPGFSWAGMRALTDTGEASDDFHDERVGADGVARFRHVRLGQRLDVYTSRELAEHRTVLGPRVADEIVAVQLEPSADSSLLRGRAVDPSGQPLAAAHVGVLLHSPAWPQPRTLWLTTGARGEFAVALAGRNLPILGERRPLSALTLLDNSVPQRWATLGARDLAIGAQDLGDLVLAVHAPLVAGELVATGEPAAAATAPLWPGEASFKVEACDELGVWRTTELRATARGAFRIDGPTPPGRLRLCVEPESTPQFLPVPPVEFTPGTTGLRIAVRAAVAVVASVRVPPTDPAGDSAADDLQLALHASDGAVHIGYTAWRGEARDQLDFALRVPSGTYDLHIRHWLREAPLLQLQGVRVTADDVDPRLGSLDLRAQLQVATLGITAPTAESPTDLDALVLAPEPEPGRPWRALPITTARRDLLLPPGRFDLWVAATGCLPVQTTVTGGRCDVVLQPWPTLRVDVPQARDAEVEVQVAVRAARAPVALRMPWHEVAPRAVWAPPGDWYPVRDGRAALPLGVGASAVLLRIGTGAALQGVTPERVVAPAERVTLTVPEVTWRAALAAARQPK